MPDRRKFIADLKHRVRLCSAEDVVTSGLLRLKRIDRKEIWAAIYAKKPQMFGPDGLTIMEDRNLPTHDICVRYRPDMLISATAWIYEQRLQSGDRWFKVQKTRQLDHLRVSWIVLQCRLVENSDEISKPIERDPVTGAENVLSKGVTL